LEEPLLIARLLSCLLPLALAACMSSDAREQRTDGVAFVGANVLPMTAVDRLPDQTVLIEGGRIRLVAPRRQVRIPPGFRPIDARGLTLMPGLVDMHVHVANVPGNKGDAAARALAVMLAHGVTTARSMAGAPSHPALRARIEAGDLPAPRLYIAAPGISAASAADEAALRAKVDAAARDRYDVLKVYDVARPEHWEVLRDAAGRKRLPIAGHVPNEIGLGRALRPGFQAEHLDATIAALLPGVGPSQSAPFGQFPPAAIVREARRAGPEAIAALARRVAATKSFHTPTLSLFERLLDDRSGAAVLRAEPAMRWVPASALDAWTAQRAQLSSDPSFSGDAATSFRELRRSIVRAYHEAGVPIMAGSDSAQAFQVWGVGLIREIETLVAAGLPPMAALRSATVVPRDYLRSLPGAGSALGWPADFGTVENGARADLILLGGDPAVDVAALRDLRGVMAAGRWHDRTTLDALLADVVSTANPAAATSR
jgi:imidazolonepropionase-like amidohydrolase